MLLNEFVKLKQDEIAIHTELLALLEQAMDEGKMSTELFNLIIKTDPIILIKLSHSNPGLEFIFKDQRLDNYWNTIWNCCTGLGNLPSLSSFDLVRGSFFYAQYQIEKEKNVDDSFPYLEEALRYNYYPSLYEYTQLILDNLKIKPDNNLEKSLLKVLEANANLYSTPGYLLTGIAYFMIASTYEKQQNLLNVNIIDKYLKEALKDLCKAQLLEQFSGPHFEVAFEKKSMSEYFDNQFESIEQIITAIISRRSDLKTWLEEARLEIANEISLPQFISTPRA